MRKRDTENVHELADNLFKQCYIEDLQGLLLNKDYEFTAAIEGLYLEKNETIDQIDKFFTWKELHTKLLLAESLNIPFFVICHCFDGLYNHIFHIIEYKRGVNSINRSYVSKFNESEFINWWKHLKGTVQTKGFRRQGEERTVDSYIDKVLAKHGLMWGGNIDGIMLSQQGNKINAIIEKRICKHTTDINTYDPAAYFYNSKDPLRNDYFTWKPLIKLAIALKCPLYLITFKSNDFTNYGLSHVNNIINGLNYYGSPPNKNLKNDISEMIKFYNKNNRLPSSRGNCKQCNNIVTEKDADFCMMDKMKYKGKVYCESCRSNWSVNSKVEVKCAHDNCYVNITENVKQYCENHKGLFGGKYYCYNHQQDMKIQNDKVCDLCGNKVPPNVIAFCEKNSERFSGRIYCYNHQKNF